MLKKIILLVTALHLTLLTLLLFSPPKKITHRNKHVVVHMVASKPPPTVVVKKAPAAVPAKKVAPTRTPVIQKKTAIVEKDKPKKKVIKEINEGLAKIEHKVYSMPRSKLDVPQIQSSPPVEPFETGWSSQEETLMSFLHASLNLPEFGEVKIQLTIKKDGSVSQMVVLQAESQKNKAYLQEYLPHLQFPLILDKEKTFILTFCNEI